MRIMISAMIGIMILLMVGVMIFVMVVLHRKPQEAEQPERMHHALSLIVNKTVSWLLRAGIPVRIFGNPVVLLTVRGRKSGQPRTTVVDLYERNGRRFLVSTHGEENAHWVRNLRAAGKATLTRGRSLEEVTVVELPPEAAGLVLKEVLGSRLKAPLSSFALRQTLEISSNASLHDFIHAATHHPVFELYSPHKSSSHD